MNTKHDKDQNTRKPHFGQVLFSTIAAAFGVQSRENQERDFTYGSIYPFIAAGIVFTLGFIGVVVLLVKSVLGSHGL